MMQIRHFLLVVFMCEAVGGLLSPAANACTSANRMRLMSSKAAIPPEISVEDDDDESRSASTPYVPPDFSVEDDGDDVVSSASTTRSSTYKPPADFTVENVDDDPYSEDTDVVNPRRPKRPKRKTPVVVAGTNWMQKNAQFSGEAGASSVEEPPPVPSSRSSTRGSDDSSERGDRAAPNGAAPYAFVKNFRQDFRGTRVFVQGIPPGISWQDLKDHFKTAGDVVFASVSVDPNTGESKGHGIVQFENTDMAAKAIKIMRDYPLDGSPLFVREDVKDNDSSAELRPKGPTPPTMWKCANEENTEYMSESETSAIKTLIKARDDARRRKKYDVSDRIRDELKENHGVFIDDRLKMWWTAIDGNKVPRTIQDINGDGRWKLKAWRMIWTTPENDACVNADLVEGLLKQRDIARREKDFSTADSLLEEARTSPDGDLELRIHDESRTWRIWTEAGPPRPVEHRKEQDPVETRESAAMECIAIVKEFAPDKIEEIHTVLKKFKGREFQVLKRLKGQYLS